MKLHKTATNIISLPIPTASNAKESTPPGAKNRGSNEDFRHMIKAVSMLVIATLHRGAIVNSTVLCAEIRYGLRKDVFVGDSNVPGLSKVERLEAGRVIWLLANAGELPLEPLGRNKANLQQYRLK